MRVRGGLSFTSYPPAFSADGNLMLVCSGSTVSVFSVATGLLAYELEGHSAPVTSIHVVKYNGVTKPAINHAWTSSLDATIRLWNFTTCSVIKTVNVGKPIHSMVVPNFSELGATISQKQCICLLLVEHSKDDHKPKKIKESSNTSDGDKEHPQSGPCFRVVSYNMTSGKPLSGHLAQVSRPALLICSQPGHLVGIVDNRKLWIWRVTKESIEHSASFQKIMLHHTKPLKSLAFDPTETLVAASDSSGRVLIWKNIGEHSYHSSENIKGSLKSKNALELDSNRGARGNDDAAALSTYHWHSDQVNFLMFSLEGAYLFSGGNEAVLVMWQLETGKKSFLPRLGSSILYMSRSPDASIISVTCADNSIKLINCGTMTVERSIKGIKPFVTLPRKLRSMDLKTVASQPGTRVLVLPTEDISLQFYDVLNDRPIGEIEVNVHNYISSKEKGWKSSHSEPFYGKLVFISHVVFARDGLSMATVECSCGEDNIARGSCLKFWRQDVAFSNFVLSTEIHDPHQSEISSLAFHPNINLAVSCCHIGDFKVWVYDKDRKDIASHISWRCRSVGSYRQKSMRCVDFSDDGTLLAVSADESITLWNPFTNSLVHVLARSMGNVVRSLSFVPSTNYLVAASEGERAELTVWNLETLSICWSYHLTVEALRVDPRGPHFSVLSMVKKPIKKKGEHRVAKAVITVFDVNSPVPQALWNVQDAEDSDILWLDASCLSDEANEKDERRDHERSFLVFLNRQREYIVFDPFKGISEELLKKSFDISEEKGTSTFESVYGKANDVAYSKPPIIATNNVAQSDVKIFNCPSHLISLRSVGLSYIESLLERQTVLAQ
ncbi:hypothetical protein KP509_03G099700 [Ceratopteris richardii]|uniref:WD repeat-containing protein 75 second beta-propeller domain-containing protein n=1 Tax=Ceratopteris richardii TaxID=49495 RepID=A0A8T2VAK0_CERRI|nr:hypothetical protein KP509_03G099700 [Ceratopteris richardii]KAH7442695.1 hypothetical protein KP509_03G099700 [Ceratopteris richardii]KAH7442696.1 hypothetical protein KP509_03G099700 [Ceratopteris richardii]